MHPVALKTLISAFLISGHVAAQTSLGPEIFESFMGCYDYVSFDGKPYVSNWLGLVHKKSESLRFKDLNGAELSIIELGLTRPDGDEAETIDSFDIFLDRGTFTKEDRKTCYQYSGELIYFYPSYIDTLDTSICMEAVDETQVRVSIYRISKYMEEENFQYVLNRFNCE